MEKKTRNTMIMVILFSTIAIIFAILHVVGIVKNLDSYLAMTCSAVLKHLSQT